MFAFCVLALSALKLRVLATGAVPDEQGLLPSELATAPGVIVTEHVAPASKVAPHVVVCDVPEGHVGELTIKFVAVNVPEFVKVNTLGTPEDGVPETPYSVIPLTLRAKFSELKDNVVLSTTGIVSCAESFEQFDRKIKVTRIKLNFFILVFILTENKRLGANS